MTRQALSVILSLCVIGTTASAAFAQSSAQKSTSRRAVEATALDTVRLHLALEAAKIDTLKQKSDTSKLQLTEDIEIMRRLLDATVNELYSTVSTNQVLNISQSGSSSSLLDSNRDFDFYGGPVSKSKTPQSRSNPFSRFFYSRTAVPGNTKRIRNRQIREPIGTYLNGHGVVYQLELPPLSEPAKPAKTVAKKSLADCPVMSLSKWDRTRKHLSGELKKINCSACHAINENHPFLGHAAELKFINCSKCHMVDKNFNSADANFKTSFSGRSNSRWITQFLVRESSASVLTREKLTERLIDLLAENGHHIRDLPSSQYLTLSVTFREPSPVTQATTGMGDVSVPYWGTSAPAAGVSGPSPGRIYSTGSAIVLSGPPTIPLGTPGVRSSGKPSSRTLPQNIKRTQKKTPNGIGAAAGGGSGFGEDPGGFGGVSGYAGTPAKLSNQELAGDLYMRQENFKKAAGEYEKALEKASLWTETIRSSFPIPFSHTVKKKQPENRRLLRKLAVAWLRGGEISKAKAVLDKLASFENTKRSSRSKQPETASVSLPARLVISVTKANLDAVAAGKMSHVEFRKQVSVDYFDPASVKPKQDDKQKSKP